MARAQDDEATSPPVRAAMRPSRARLLELLLQQQAAMDAALVVVQTTHAQMQQMQQVMAASLELVQETMREDAAGY